MNFFHRAESVTISTPRPLASGTITADVFIKMASGSTVNLVLFFANDAASDILQSQAQAHNIELAKDTNHDISLSMHGITGLEITEEMRVDDWIITFCLETTHGSESFIVYL